MVIPVGDDANVSLVVTASPSRRQAVADRLLRQGLCRLREDGFRSARLQATEVAGDRGSQGLYASAGFRAVGQWQEWLPRSAR